MQHQPVNHFPSCQSITDRCIRLGAAAAAVCLGAGAIVVQAPMSAMIECTNCGAIGESNFSTNYFGELVCELCGTQSFLQSRNETQDMDDTNLDFKKISTMKQRKKRKKRVKKEGGGSGDDDGDGDGTTRASRRRRMKKKRAQGATLVNCLRATQTILDYQAQAVMQLAAFPEEYADVVQELWFLFLEMWELKSSRPLLRCFTEFFVHRGTEDKAMDPALTQQLLEQWDIDRVIESAQASAHSAAMANDDDDDEKEEGDDGNEDEEVATNMKAKPRTTEKETNGDERQPKKKRERTNKRMRLIHYSEHLDRFSIMDLVGILVLAARVLNLGVLPCDFAYWVATGQLPFHNLLSVCSPELKDAVCDVALFFESGISGHKACASRIAYHAHYLQHHLELRLPPLNVSLVAYNLCANLGFPAQVFRHFQWIAACFNIKGDVPEQPLLGPKEEGRGSKDEHLLDSSVGIVAHLAVAVKMCANWHEWIYERELHRKQHVPPYLDEQARRMPRRELDDFVDFCEEALVGRDRANIPSAFESHVSDLRGKYSEINQQHHHQRRRRGSRGDGDDGASHRPQEHALHAYPALYTNGICDEKDEEIEERVAFIKHMLQQQEQHGNAPAHLDEDEVHGKEEDVFFYPFYPKRAKFSPLHSVYENVLSLLCEYVDIPIATVLTIAQRMDKRMMFFCQDFVTNSHRRSKRKAAAAES